MPCIFEDAVSLSTAGCGEVCFISLFLSAGVSVEVIVPGLYCGHSAQPALFMSGSTRGPGGLCLHWETHQFPVAIKPGPPDSSPAGIVRAAQGCLWGC